MKMEENKLKELAKIFKPYSTLYAVGGFVRDKLMNIASSDVDICSSLAVDKVKDILSDGPFVVQNRNLRMGTIIITNGDSSFEYTTFRVDSYDKNSGEHSPKEVTFTDDINKDALRRDFKCNAVYYDILNDKVIDIIGGVKDIENRIISTADVPDTVFEADGLRILRMVRFAVELGFDIDKETYLSAKRNAWRVKDISVERIKDELDKIFIADTKHKELNLTDAHYRGVQMLDDLDLVELLLPELNALKGLQQPKQYHLYDAYVHSLMAFKASDPSIRWAALCHDIGKIICMSENGNMHGHELVGADAARKIASRYKFSKEEAKEFVFLIKYHMLKDNMRLAKTRRFVVTNYWAMNKLVCLLRADCIGACGHSRRFKVEDIIDEINQDGTPLSIKDLKVNGNDLIELNVDESDRAKILNEIWDLTIVNPSLNNRDWAIDYIKRKVKK